MSSTEDGIRGRLTGGVSTAAEADALVLGLGILSTGGGGTTERGGRYLRELLDGGFTVRWISPEQLADDVLTCSVFGMGSIAPHEPLSAEEQHAAGYRGERFARPAVRAVQELSSHLGEPVGAVVPFELGPFNTVVALDAAARLGLPVIDGDYVGRATPELSQALPSLLGHDALPAAVCDQWGSCMLLIDAPSPAIVEALGKAVSTVTKRPDTRGTCAHAAFPLEARGMRSCIVPGTLSRSLALGIAVMDARACGADPVQAIVAATEGRELLRGTIRDIEWTSSRGYMDGTLIIDLDESDGGEGRIWFRNENHVIWRGDEVLATSPDLIAVVSSASGEPLPNSALPLGESIAAIGIPGDPRYREGDLLHATCPAHYGLTTGHVPV